MGVSGLLLLFPFLLLRFGLLGRLGRDGLGRAAHIPPMGGRERLAYWVYQLSSAGVLVCLCAQRAEVDGAWPFWAGLVLYLLGVALCAGAVVSFGRPSPGPFREDGLYRFSRNPMYVSFRVFCGVRPADPLPAPGRPGPAVPALGALDHPGGGAVVQGAVRRTLRGVSEAGQAVSLIRVGRRLFPWSIL